MSKLRGRLSQLMCPSQKTWTLKRSMFLVILPSFMLKGDVTWGPASEVTNNEEIEAKFPLVHNCVFNSFRYNYRSSSDEHQNPTELKCWTADSVPTKTETDETRLVLSSADYNLSWGVLTHKRS